MAGGYDPDAKPLLGIERFHGRFNIVMDLGELGDPYHIEDFYKMVGKTRDADELIAFLGLGENLNEHGDTAAVDIGFRIEIQQNFFGFLLVDLFVGIVEKRFGKSGNISFDLQQSDGPLLGEVYFVGVLHD